MSFYIIVALAFYVGGACFTIGWLKEMVADQTWWERLVFALLWPLVLAAALAGGSD